jgi:transposase
MQSVTTIGPNIAKSVFHVHGIDTAGQVVIRRKLKRRYVLAFFEKLPPCLVGIEACASSPSLVPRAAGAGAYGAIDAAG